MSAASREKLYSPALLALATQLARYPLHDGFSLVGEARSRTCGSAVTCGITTDADGKILELGIRASACAVGQAAAAIFAACAVGKSVAEIDQASLQLSQWLAGGSAPDWPEIEALEPALAFPARHAAIQLAWKAASEALSNTHVAS